MAYHILTSKVDTDQTRTTDKSIAPKPYSDFVESIFLENSQDFL